MDGWINFLVFWGVWLFIPMLVDGLSTVASLFGVFIMRFRRKRFSKKLDFLPMISIVIPVFNSADTLKECLQSISEQDYPLHLIDVLLVNNGSTDKSFEIFSRLQLEFDLTLSWHSIMNQGKSWALNAGIYLARGKYIFNVDSDVVLAPDAVRVVVETMESQPDLGAATGAVEVLPPGQEASFWMKIVNELEFFEYLTAFHVGREHQTLLRNLYTLSGAFSIFRREILMQTFLYSQETVTEDTDLTFDLYDRFKDIRVGCISPAVAYVHPISSIGALYSQRVRWQRGQIEVSARHENLLKKPFWHIMGFNPARILIIDHTLAFPRAVWTFLLPVLTLFGYSGSLIVMALLMLLVFYLLIDLLWMMVAMLDVNKMARQRLEKIGWKVLFLPIYRMIIFWFRFSGFLYAMAEPGEWKVANPLTMARSGFLKDWSSIKILIQKS